jgi:tRNA A37 threonylcarbamoyladenosine dehydratase
LQLTRNYNFLGEEAMVKVREGYVVVVGCGGVGSWCALMLLRRCDNERSPDPADVAVE